MTSIHDLAPSYVHDALGGDEVIAYQDHLASCRRCQEDVALLGGRKVDGTRRFGFEAGSPLQFAVIVLAAAIVVIGLAIYLG